MADKKQIDIQDYIERARELFGMVSPQVIGVDIGQSAIKISELEKKKNKFKLVKFSTIPLPEASIVEDEIQKVDEVILAIKEALKTGRFSTSQACVGLYGPSTVARKLQLAGGSEEELEDQVYWEAEQYLPFSLDESNIDHYLVGENIGGGVDVIVAAVKKDVLYRFKDLLDRASAKVKIADISALAISNVFSEYLTEKGIEDDNRTRMLIDFGAQKTFFIIFRGNAPIFVKEIMIGGTIVTEEIQRQLGVNYQEAEDLKITTDKSGNLPEEIIQIIRVSVDGILGEIRKSYDIYINSTSDDDLLGCFVTGGSIRLPGFLDELAHLLNTDITVLNPFEYIEYSKDFKEGELAEIAHVGLVSMGLAMRSVEV